MDLSIIIVNWNSKDYLENCIDSIVTTTHGVKYEIIVIDNASYDGCDEMLRIRFPQVKFIQSEKNLGFAGANNKAFEMAGGRNVLFLNPDTEVKEQSIQSLLLSLTSLSNAGIVGAKLLNSYGTVQISCVQAFPTILNQIFDAELLRKHFPKSKLWGMTPLFTEAKLPSEVDVASGACLMIKREVFEEVGKFSEEYFMYSEDVDLCYKVHKAGWKTYYVPLSIVVHHGGGSSSQVEVNTFSSIMMLESRWRFFRKFYPRWYCWIYRFSMGYVSIARIIILLLSWPYLSTCGSIELGNAALKKWYARFLWIIGRQ